MRKIFKRKILDINQKYFLHTENEQLKSIKKRMNILNLQQKSSVMM